MHVSLFKDLTWPQWYSLTSAMERAQGEENPQTQVPILQGKVQEREGLRWFSKENTYFGIKNAEEIDLVHLRKALRKKKSRQKRF